MSGTLPVGASSGICTSRPASTNFLFAIFLMRKYTNPENAPDTAPKIIRVAPDVTAAG